MGLFVITFCVLSALFALGASADVPDSGCFDFSAPWKTIQESRAGQGNSGNVATGGYWATTSGITNRSIQEILADLLSHESTKSGRIAVMEIEPIMEPKYQSFQKIHFEVHPFPLINVEWDENWAYLVTEGTKDDPRKVTIGYQKVRGTSHIKHLCGNYLLTRKDSQTTELSIAEESEATNRTLPDVENDIRASLDKLGRKSKP